MGRPFQCGDHVVFFQDYNPPQAGIKLFSRAVNRMHGRVMMIGLKWALKFWAFIKLGD